MSKLEFLNKSKEDQDKSSQVKFELGKDNITICKLYDSRFKKTFIGMSKPKPGDTFDEMKGREVAFCKAKLQELGYNKAFLKFHIKKSRNILEDYISRFENRVKKLNKERDLVIQELSDLSQ